MIRSHSSRSRQDDLLRSREENPYSKHVESLLQDRNYDNMSDHQVLQENNLLRMHLKNFNKELNTLIERQALKPSNKAVNSQFKSKPASAKIRTLNEEIKNNEKKLCIFRDELTKYSGRMQAIGEGTYLIDIHEKIENTRRSIEEQKKFNKQILLEQKKQGKNLDNIENIAGMPEKLVKGNEIAVLLPGLSKKNQMLKERNDLVMIQIEELERKNDAIQDKYDKALQLADAYKLFRNVKKREAYEATQARVEALERNIQMIGKKNEKVFEMHKRAMDDLHKALREKDEQISLKEQELLIQRQRIEELMLTEKINKDTLTKIFPPTPKTHNTTARRKTETPLNLIESDPLESKEPSKEEQRIEPGLRQSSEAKILPKENQDFLKKSPENTNETKSPGNPEPERKDEMKDAVKKEEPIKMLKFNKGGQKDSNLFGDSNLVKPEEQQQPKPLNSMTEEPKMLKMTKSPENPKLQEEQKTFNLGKSEQSDPKKPEIKPQEEPVKSFNFSRRKADEQKPVLQDNTNNNTNPNYKPETNKPFAKNETGLPKKEKKLDLFNNDDGTNFGFIPEIKTVERNHDNPASNTNNVFIENNKTNNKNEIFKEEPPKNEFSSNIGIPSNKPRKIIADPFDEKPKVDNFDNEFFDDLDTKPKKMQIGMNSQKKPEVSPLKLETALS